MKKLSKEVKAAIKYLEEYPASYDAHRDALSDPYEHRDAVNKLLAIARTLAEALKK